MSKEKIYIFDTTLRDGAQTQGVDFSLNEKEKQYIFINNNDYRETPIQNMSIYETEMSEIQAPERPPLIAHRANLSRQQFKYPRPLALRGF